MLVAHLGPFAGMVVIQGRVPITKSKRRTSIFQRKPADSIPDLTTLAQKKNPIEELRVVHPGSTVQALLRCREMKGCIETIEGSMVAKVHQSK
jgi:hypothetical protein